MAITIDGAGTITGVVAGGLPDASVTNDDLATGIASSKLTGALPAISGASLTSLTSGNLSGALPALDGSSLTNISALTKGSNANGEWHKFTDGTLICTWGGGYTLEQNVGPSAGGFYFSNAYTWTFPVSFNATPRVVANPTGGHWNAINARADSIGTTSCTYKTLSVNSTANDQGVEFIAIGTWS